MEHHQNSPKTTRRARGRPAVLEYLSVTQNQSLSTIAEEMGQSAATVYRILVTLEGRGLVEFDSVEQVWAIGSKAFVIGSSFLRRTSLVERARPIMRRLMENTGETANLGIEKEGQVLFLSQVETHANIRAFFPPGSLSPMHSSGIGKALLAYMHPDRLNRNLASTELKSYTPHTITNSLDLRANLEDIVARGFAIDDEEKNTGMRCIAAAVFDMNGEAIAGLSVSGPTSRVNLEQTERLSKEVIAAANQLTAAVGGEAPSNLR